MEANYFQGKKAQGIGIIVKIMVGIMAFIVGAIVIPPINDEITITMNASNLDCTNSSISAVHKTTCTVVDLGFFYFISSVIAVGLAFVAGKRSITGVLTSIFVFIITVALITPLKDLIILARDATHLNCGGSIAVGANLTCIFVDLWLFYFVAIAIASAVTLIFIKTTAEIK